MKLLGSLLTAAGVLLVVGTIGSADRGVIIDSGVFLRQFTMSIIVFVIGALILNLSE